MVFVQNRARRQLVSLRLLPLMAWRSLQQTIVPVIQIAPVVPKSRPRSRPQCEHDAVPRTSIRCASDLPTS